MHAEDEKLNACVESRYHEYRGAFLGLMIGSLLAIGIITGLVVTGGLIAAPGTTLFLTTITSGSVVSALFSRIGCVIDGINRACIPPVLVEEKDTHKFPVILILNRTDIKPTSERKEQTHPYVLINKASNPVVAVIENSSERSQEQSHLIYVMEVQIGKRPAKILGQNRASFYPPDKKARQEEVYFSQADRLTLSCS